MQGIQEIVLNKKNIHTAKKKQKVKKDLFAQLFNQLKNSSQKEKSIFDDIKQQKADRKETAFFNTKKVLENKKDPARIEKASSEKNILDQNFTFFNETLTEKIETTVVKRKINFQNKKEEKNSFFLEKKYPQTNSKEENYKNDKIRPKELFLIKEIPEKTNEELKNQKNDKNQTQSHVNKKEKSIYSALGLKKDKSLQTRVINNNEQITSKKTAFKNVNKAENTKETPLKNNTHKIKREAQQTYTNKENIENLISSTEINKNPNIENPNKPNIITTKVQASIKQENKISFIQSKTNRIYHKEKKEIPNEYKRQEFQPHKQDLKKSENIEEGKLLVENKNNFEKIEKTKDVVQKAQKETKPEKTFTTDPFTDLKKENIQIKYEADIKISENKSNPLEKEKIESSRKIQIKTSLKRKYNDPKNSVVEPKKHEHKEKNKEINKTDDFVVNNEIPAYIEKHFYKDERIEKSSQEKEIQVSSIKDTASLINEKTLNDSSKENAEGEIFYHQNESQEKPEIENKFQKVFTLSVNFNDTNLIARLRNNTLNLSILLNNANVQTIHTLKTEISQILKEHGFENFNLKIETKGRKIYYSNNYERREKREIDVKV